jgi:hypothetical protein
MPSAWHDSVTELFRQTPDLAVEILRDLMGVPLPAVIGARVEPPGFNDRPSTDFDADVVIVAGPRHDPVHGIIVEAQQGRRPEKLDAIARYAAALWLMLRCPVDVLVICPDAETATWYGRPITTTLTGYMPCPRALHPDLVPAITDASQVTADPGMGALSVAFHGEVAEVRAAFVAGLTPLKSEGTQYYEYGYCLSPTVVRKLLEELVASTSWPVYSPFAKEHFGRGLAEGEAKGEADAVLLVLEARGLDITDAQRDRITGCTDLDQLRTWVRRAATLTAASELFE